MPSSARALTVPTSGNRLPALDGVRGVAILLILVVHFTMLPARAVGVLAPEVPLIDRAFINATFAGWVGVDLFLVLSGFLITGILYESKSAARHYFRNFYARRALRILPVYYGLFVVLLIALPLFLSSEIEAVGSLTSYLLWYATFLHNIRFAIDAAPIGAFSYLVVHLWSLAVEEQFYLVWPFIVLLFPRRVLMSICVLSVVSALLVRIGMYAMDVAPTAIYTTTPARMDALAVGAFVALVARDPSDLRSLLRWAWPIAIVSFVTLVVLVLQRAELHPYNPRVQIAGHTALALLFGMLVLAAATTKPGTIIHGLLTRWELTGLGRYSYALYLFNWPVVNLMIRHWDVETAMPLVFGSAIPRILLFWLVAFAISLGAAMLSWHLWEKQFLRLKRWFPYSLSEPEPSPSADSLGDTSRPRMPASALRGRGAIANDAETFVSDEDVERRAA